MPRVSLEPAPAEDFDKFSQFSLTPYVLLGRNAFTSSTKGGQKMRLASDKLPKITRETTPTLDPKLVAEALKDLEGSYDYKPYAFGNDVEYKTNSKATSAANTYVKALAKSTGEDPRMFRRKVWDKNGAKDRKANGKWVFAISRRSTPPPARKPRKAKLAAAA